MSNERYKITTATKTFFVDNLKSDLFKKDKSTFFVREKSSDDWENLVQLEKQISILEWWNDNVSWVAVISGFIFYIIFIVIFAAFGEQLLGDWIGLAMIFLHPALFYLLFYLSCIATGKLITHFLKDIPPYFTTLSNSKIQKLIEQSSSKPHKASNSYTSSGYRSGGYSGGSGHSGGGSRDSGDSGGGYSGSYSGGGGSGSRAYSVSSTYISSADMDNALKALNDKGLGWKVLANDKTDEEREKLFIEHFGDEEKGKLASDRFNRTDIYPAREAHLNKLITESEFEDDSIKTKLLDKVKSFDDKISKNDFDGIVHEIVTFKEKKKRIDKHTKYEGRLSNKDIQTIKEHFGYVCMACGLNPAEEYGAHMKSILEAHHKSPYSEITEGETREVKADDFLILCPNCHKLIHKLDSPNDLDGLKKLVNKPSKSWWWD